MVLNLLFLLVSSLVSPRGETKDVKIKKLRFNCIKWDQMNLIVRWLCMADLNINIVPDVL